MEKRYPLTYLTIIFKKNLCINKSNIKFINELKFIDGINIIMKN